MFVVVGTGLWVRSGLFFPNFFIAMTNFKQSSVIQFASFIVYFTECCYCCSVTCCSCPTLCDPMDNSMSGFLVLLYLSEFVQTHVHCVDDVIQPSHPVNPLLPSGSSQYQDLFQ